MSIDTLLPLAEASPPAHATPPRASDAGATVTASLQERRLRAARELDVRIRGLEQETLRLATELEAARRAAREHLGELQQRSTSLTTEVLRVGARLARQGRDHEAQRRLLDQRLCQRLRELESALTPLGESLQTQAGQLRELESRHETLSRLHQHLDRIVNRQGRGLDIVAAEFEQRVELLRASLEGIQALFRDQQESQMRIAVEQEGLSTVTQALQARLDDNRAEFSLHREETRQRLGVLARLLAALALVSLGLIAWCQFHPVALPTDAQDHLSTLATRQDLQDSSNARFALQLSRHAEALAATRRELQQLHHDNRRLREDARRQQTRLRRLAGRLTAASKPIPTPPAQTAQTAQTTTTPATVDAPQHPTATSPWTPPGDTPLPLPIALPGSRADF